MHTSLIQEAGLPQGAGPARMRVAGLLEACLLALLATLLGRPRTVAAAWYSLAQTLSDDAYFADESDDWALDEYPANPYRVLTHNHADCDPRILYVIGPRPNRGMRPTPRRIPFARPRTARAPPKRPQVGWQSGRNPSPASLWPFLIPDRVIPARVKPDLSMASMGLRPKPHQVRRAPSRDGPSPWTS